LITLFERDNSRILEACISSVVDKYTLDCDENTTPFSSGRGSVDVTERIEGAGDGDGKSALGRDLNENFGFGRLFVFSCDIRSESSLSCYG
jgi:hypothetical protein